MTARARPGDELYLTEPLGAGIVEPARAAGPCLLGHVHDLCAASGVAAEIRAGAVPAVDGAIDLLASPEPPLGEEVRRNRDTVSEWVRFFDDVPEERRWLLCDPIAPGAVLAAAPHSGAPGAPIGRLVDGEPGRIAVRA